MLFACLFLIFPTCVFRVTAAAATAAGKAFVVYNSREAGSRGADRRVSEGWRVQLVTIKAGSAAICWQPNHLQGFIPIQ